MAVRLISLQQQMDEHPYCIDPLNLVVWTRVGPRKGRRVEYAPRDCREPLQRERNGEPRVPDEVPS